MRGRRQLCYNFFFFKIIAKLNAANQLTPPKPTEDQWQDLNAILKSRKTLASKELEGRLLALVELISQAKRSGELDNAPASHIMELFNYKIEKFNAVESSMQKRLEEASQEVHHTGKTLFCCTHFTHLFLMRAFRLHF